MTTTTAAKPKFTAKRAGAFIAVERDGVRVALLHPKDCQRWAEGEIGRELRKYVELAFEGEKVRNWAPLDARFRRAAYVAAAKICA